MILQRERERERERLKRERERETERYCKEKKSEMYDTFIMMFARFTRKLKRRKRKNILQLYFTNYMPLML